MYRDQVKYPLFLRYCRRCTEIIKWNIHYSWDIVTDVQRSSSEVSSILEILSQMYSDQQVKYPLFLRYCHRCTEIIKWSFHYSVDIVTDVQRSSSEVSTILEIPSQMYIDDQVKYPLFLTYFNETWIICVYFRKKNTQILNFVEILQMVTELLPADGLTDRQTGRRGEAISHVSQFCNCAWKQSYANCFNLAYHKIWVWFLLYICPVIHFNQLCFEIRHYKQAACHDLP